MRLMGYVRPYKARIILPYYHRRCCGDGKLFGCIHRAAGEFWFCCAKSSLHMRRVQGALNTAFILKERINYMIWDIEYLERFPYFLSGVPTFVATSISFVGGYRS